MPVRVPNIMQEGGNGGDNVEYNANERNVARVLFGRPTPEDSIRLNLDLEAMYAEGRQKLENYEILGVERVLQSIEKPSNLKVEENTPMESDDAVPEIEMKEVPVTDLKKDQASTSS